MLEKGGNVDVVYTDFEKAYEKVDHWKLLEKAKTNMVLQESLENGFTTSFIIESRKSL